LGQEHGVFGLNEPLAAAVATHRPALAIVGDWAVALGGGIQRVLDVTFVECGWLRRSSPVTMLGDLGADLPALGGQLRRAVLEDEPVWRYRPVDVYAEGAQAQGRKIYAGFVVE